MNQLAHGNNKTELAHVTKTTYCCVDYATPWLSRLATLEHPGTGPGVARELPG